jgi:hypothetical protein
VVTPNDGQPIAIAVIFEEWHTGPEALVTFVIVTTAPNALIRFASQTGCLLSAARSIGDVAGRDWCIVATAANQQLRTGQPHTPH